MSDYMCQQLGYTNTFDLKTTITESTITHTTTDLWGRIVEEVMNTKEKATRDALLYMGWLPPETSYERFMRKVITELEQEGFDYDIDVFKNWLMLAAKAEDNGGNVVDAYICSGGIRDYD